MFELWLPISDDLELGVEQEEGTRLGTIIAAGVVQDSKLAGTRS